ncbi:MAG: hypothetical protein ACM3ZA_05805 [Bacillota bacterium]
MLALVQVFVYLWAASTYKKGWVWAAALLALLHVVLLMTPDMDLVKFIVGLNLPGDLPLYLSSALYVPSRWGVATYGVLTVLPFVLARPWAWGAPRGGSAHVRGVASSDNHASNR